MRILLVITILVNFASIAQANVNELPVISIDSHRERTIEDTNLVNIQKNHPGIHTFGLANPLDDRASDVAAGISTAKSIVSLAATKSTNAQLTGILNTVSAAFPSTTIKHPPVGQDFKGCDEGTLAFVMMGTPIVYLCNAAVSANINSNVYAQIIIHEMAHVVGYGNECDATVIEVASMTFSGVGIQFKNGYYDQCIGN